MTDYGDTEVGRARRRFFRPHFRVFVFAAILVLAISAGASFAAFRMIAGKHHHYRANHAPPAASAADLAYLQGIASKTAAAMGDSHPTDEVVVATTRQAAVSVVTGALVDSNQAAYLISLHGDFVGYAAHIAPGHSPPKGHVLTLAVDANTHDVTDWSIGDASPDLSTLGPVTPLGP